MAKKASANMWWIIIGAVIALVVMIILMVMFTGKTQPLEKGLSSCESKGGVCAKGVSCPTNTFSASAFDCPSDLTNPQTKATCCIGSPKTCTNDASCASDQRCSSAEYGNKKYCYTPK